MMPRTRAKHVVVAEDDSDIRLLLELHLRRLGWVVRVVANGRDVAPLVLSQRTDLLVLDWTLPDMSGAELLDAFREDPRTRDVPILMLTARAEEAAKKEGLGRGATAYMTKPFTLSELAETIQELI